MPVLGMTTEIGGNNNDNTRRGYLIHPSHMIHVLDNYSKA
jgi:hypothetical protein